MISNIDNIIERLQHDSDTISNVVNIEYKNLYKYDKDFTYRIDKKEDEVVVKYKGIVYGFRLPVIIIPLTPPLSYLLFWRRTYVHSMIDTFKLDYSLSMYYTICLHTFIKNNINNNKSKENE